MKPGFVRMSHDATMERAVPLHKGAVLINASYAGSLINFRKELILTLVRAGYEVHAAAPDMGPNVQEAIVALGAVPHEVSLSRLGQNPLSDLRYLRSLLALFKLVRPVCVINYTIKPNIWGSIAAAIMGVRSVSMVTGLGYAFYEAGSVKHRLVSVVSKMLYALATRFNDKIVFQNPDDRDDFIAAGCLKDTRKIVMVNGSGVDICAFQEEELPDQPVFLMIGRFLKSKGLREYAQAAIGIMKKRQDCKFLLVGIPDDGVDGVSAAELQQWADQGLECLGFRQDVRPALASASIFVLPSYREGTPRTVLEAMAMGRAVITTDAPGCRETVKSGTNGLLVPPKNTEKLMEAMEYLADNPEQRTAMGKAGRQIAEQKYASDKVAFSLVEQIGLGTGQLAGVR